MTKIANFDTGDVRQSGGISVGSGAGGDLGGSYPGPTVTGIQGYPFSGTPTAGQVPSFDDANDEIDWITPSAGVTDHGALTGLADDDHSAYVTVTGGGSETRQAHGTLGATETIDLANGNWHTGLLDQDVALTIVGFTAGEGDSALVGLSQDGTGGWAVTWDADVDFGGADDQPAQAASALTWYVLWTDAGDGTIYGAKVGGGGVSGGTPALTLSTTNATGVATTAILTDATIAVFDATVPTTAAASDAAAAGSAAFAARRDHRHGMPAFTGELLVADVAVDFPHGTFFTTATQTVASSSSAYAVAFAGEGDVDGLTHSTVTNNSRIYIDQSGEYNIIVSAIGDLTSGTNQHIDVWLAIDGSPVADSNTIVQIQTTAETIIAAAFNLDLTAGQYFEIMYHSDSTNAQLLQTAAASSPTRPASPAVILTVNMEAPIVGFVSKGITLLMNDANDDLLYADT